MDAPTIIFMCAMFVALVGMVIHFRVLAGLRRRRVAIRYLWSGTPGYLSYLCRQLPPSAENSRLTGLAKFSDILFVLAFVVVVITGPLLNQGAQ